MNKHKVIDKVNSEFKDFSNRFDKIIPLYNQIKNISESNKSNHDFYLKVSEQLTILHNKRHAFDRHINSLNEKFLLDQISFKEYSKEIESLPYSYAEISVKLSVVSNSIKKYISEVNVDVSAIHNYQIAFRNIKDKYEEYQALIYLIAPSITPLVNDINSCFDSPLIQNNKNEINKIGLLLDKLDSYISNAIILCSRLNECKQYFINARINMETARYLEIESLIKMCDIDITNLNFNDAEIKINQLNYLKQNSISSSKKEEYQEIIKKYDSFIANYYDSFITILANRDDEDILKELTILKKEYDSANSIELKVKRLKLLLIRLYDFEKEEYQRNLDKFNRDQIQAFLKETSNVVSILEPYLETCAEKEIKEKYYDLKSKFSFFYDNIENNASDSKIILENINEFNRQFNLIVEVVNDNISKLDLIKAIREHLLLESSKYHELDTFIKAFDLDIKLGKHIKAIEKVLKYLEVING